MVTLLINLSTKIKKKKQQLWLKRETSFERVHWTKRN